MVSQIPDGASHCRHVTPNARTPWNHVDIPRHKKALLYALQATRQQNLRAEVAEEGKLIHILFPALLSSSRETPRHNSSVTYPCRVLIMMTG